MSAKPASPEFLAWVKAENFKLLPMTRQIVASGDTHAPAMFIYPKDDKLEVQIVPIGQFFASTAGKKLIGLLHQKIAQDEEVKACCVLTETWSLLVEVPLEERDKLIKEGIEDHPSRVEGIMFNWINSEKMQLLATYHIKRPDNTLPDAPDILMDPSVGILEGPLKSAPGAISHTVGRMILPVDEGEKH